MEDDVRKKKRRVYDACPHCGRKLSPWQQVLLNVDRTLMCRNCWYRIIFDVEEDDKGTPDSGDEKPTSDH